jgi:hypothetical protein
MNARPYALLAASTVSAIEQKLDGIVAGWCVDWGVEKSTITIEYKRAWEATALPWASQWVQYGQPDQKGTVWLCGQDKAAEALQSQMFPSEVRYGPVTLSSTRSMASEASASAMASLITNVAGTFCGAEAAATDARTTQPEYGMGKPGSGAIAAVIRIGSATLTLLLDHACVRRNALETVRPVSKALSRAKKGDLLSNISITLELELGRAQVGVGNLITLVPGDVIRLDTAVDQPLTVFNTERQAVLSGYLATSGGTVVLELAGAA